MTAKLWKSSSSLRVLSWKNEIKRWCWPCLYFIWVQHFPSSLPSSDDADKKSVSPYLKRARNSEERYRKRHSDGCQYDVADIGGFYRHAALSQQMVGELWVMSVSTDHYQHHICYISLQISICLTPPLVSVDPKNGTWRARRYHKGIQKLI